MVKCIKNWVGVPLALFTLFANAINLPKNWEVIMNYLPQWAGDDWVRLALGVLSLGYLVWISWPYIKNRFKKSEESKEKQRSNSTFIKAGGKVEGSIEENKIPGGMTLIDADGDIKADIKKGPQEVHQEVLS